MSELTNEFFKSCRPHNTLEFVSEELRFRVGTEVLKIGVEARGRFAWSYKFSSPGAVSRDCIAGQ